MQQAPASNQDHEYTFGPYRLSPSARVLLNGGQPVRLSSRAFDLLRVLVERAGEVVTKEQLMALVWPSTVVEENNLRVHIGTLRKVLSDDQPGSRYVENVVGRGYSFVAPVVRHRIGAGAAADADSPDSTPPVAAALEPARLPLLQTRIIGRDQVLEQLSAQVAQHRCVTVAGPGGMGKTTIALATAEAAQAAFGRHIYFLDLAPVADPQRVVATLAVALGLPALDSDPLPAMLSLLRERRALIVFDSCEHLIDAVAALAARLLRDTRQLHLLATSREPLRIDDEWVHRLAPLEVPAPDAPGARAAGALSYSAVQLFAERAQAGSASFALDAANLAHVSDICRRLDGIPLAIELAAGRVEFYGVAGVAAQLQDCFALLVRGRRTALPRHQTLRATLDWSHDLLSPVEQVLLRRCAVFRGDFTLAAALAVITCERIGKAQALDTISSLHAKSLLSANTGTDTPCYRLLDTTRAYAFEKLLESGEAASVARRHAQYYSHLLGSAQGDWELLATADWVARYGRSIDHVRAALDWAFSTDGDIGIGTSLTSLSAPLWYQLSLMDEYCGRLQLALARAGEAGGLEPRCEMELQLALGHTLLHTQGALGDLQCAAAFGAALALARRLCDPGSTLRALWGTFADAVFRAEYAQALDYAEQFGAGAHASGDEALKVIYARLMALSLHYCGEQARARPYIDFVVGHPLNNQNRARNNGFQFDQKVSSLAIQGLVMWLQGEPSLALRTVRSSIEEGRQVGHAISLCFAATVAAVVALWSGERQAADDYVQLLLQQAGSGMLPNWHFWGRALRAGWLHNFAPGSPELEPLDELECSPFCGPLQREVMASLHPALLGAVAIERAADGRAGWCRAEIWRIQGERLLEAAGADAAAQAEALFQRGLALAREQSALGWELRCAISLVRRQPGPANMELLRQACGRYPADEQTADLRIARALQC